MAADAAADATEPAEFGILGPLEVLGPAARCPWAARGSGRCWRCWCLRRTGSCRWTGWPRTSGGGPAGGVGHDVADVRVPPAPGAGAGPGPGRRGGVLVTRDRGYVLRVDREQLDAAVPGRSTAGRAALEAGRYARPRRYARRWICGAARCSPTWPTTRSSGRGGPAGGAAAGRA